MKPRQWRLAGALVLTLGASLWAAMQDVEDEPVRTASERRVDTRVASASSARLAEGPGASVATAQRLPELPAAASRAPLAPKGAGFAAPLSFRPPPPPPPPAPRPMAPPLPFRYVGAIDETGQRRALVLHGEQLHIVRAGDEIDGRYRVERIGEAGIEFLYLPLKQRQSLSLSRS